MSTEERINELEQRFDALEKRVGLMHDVYKKVYSLQLAQAETVLAIEKSNTIAWNGISEQRKIADHFNIESKFLLSEMTKEFASIKKFFNENK